MKKLTAFVLALICVLSLSACGSAGQEQAAAYAFRGENEYFTVSGGSILLDEEELFDGGVLEVVQSGIFQNVTSYSASFYTLKNGKQKTILSNVVVAQDGSPVNIIGDLGSTSGGRVVSNKIKGADDLRENLWFELKTTDADGGESVYALQLTVYEVHG